MMRVPAGLEGSRLGAVALVLCLLGATAALAEAAAPQRGGGHRAAPGAPARLADTGLYSDFQARRIDRRNLHYVPQYPLWSDGAGKGRWVYLPPGTAIDASNPERWVFPVGTKFWKEFAWERRVETRYLERTRSGWLYATYQWNDAGTEALLAPETGTSSSYLIAPGRPHRLPSVADCRNCHEGGRTQVLGFGALQLSPDRDPLAPHAEPPTADAVTLATLVERGLLRGLPRRLLVHPPRVEASTPRGRAALGYLHANCGGCHDTRGPLASLGLALRHSLAARDARAEPALAAVGHQSRFQLPGAAPGESFWIAPGAPPRSTVLARMASRNPTMQMPPLGTQLVDDEAVALLSAWIEQDLKQPPNPVPEVRR